MLWRLITWPFHLIGSLLGMVIFFCIVGFWIWCVYDCATRRFSDPSRKGIWLAVLIVSALLGQGWLGGALYLFFGRENRLSY